MKPPLPNSSYIAARLPILLWVILIFTACAGGGAASDARPGSRLDCAEDPRSSCVLNPSDSINEAISPIGDVDFYRLAVAETGLLTVQTIGDTDTVGALYDSEGRPIDANDDGGAGLNFRIPTLVFPGTYYLRVEGFGNTTGSYRLESGLISGGGRGVGDTASDCDVAATAARGNPLECHQWYLDRIGVMHA